MRVRGLLSSGPPAWSHRLVSERYRGQAEGLCERRNVLSPGQSRDPKGQGDRTGLWVASQAWLSLRVPQQRTWRKREVLDEGAEAEVLCWSRICDSWVPTKPIGPGLGCLKVQPEIKTYMEVVYFTISSWGAGGRDEGKWSTEGETLQGCVVELATPGYVGFLRA